MPFTVQELIGDRPRPVTAQPDEVVQAALGRMREHDYSQLPVVTSDGRPVGVVTNDSILRALTHLGAPVNEMRVRDAMARKPDEYQVEDDLFDLLDRLRDTFAVLIVDAEGKLIGIVTSYDTNEFFRRKAEDMMLVEDIESALKEMIRGAFTNDAGETNESNLGAFIGAVAGARHEKRKSSQQMLHRYLAVAASGSSNGVKLDEEAFDRVFEKIYPAPERPSLDQLTLNDYIQLLLHDSKWNYFQAGFGLDRAAIRRLLDGVRKTRNSLAHFRDTLSPDERDRLRFCVDWLSRVQQMLAPQRVERLALPTLQPVSMRPQAGAPGVIAEDNVLDAEDVQVEDSRYAPLALYLKAQLAHVERVEMSFSQVEEIIRGRLPATARQHRSWWANDSRSHVQSRQWFDVGWRVAMVSINEERVAFARARDREQLYIQFFSQVQTELRAKASFPLRTASPSGQSWIWICGVPEEGTQSAALAFSFALGGRFRVELYINRRDADYNKRVFDALHAQREAIEAELGAPLQWERLDDKMASRIAAYHSGAITDDEKALAELRSWAVDMMVRLQKVMEPRLRDIVRKLAA